MGFLRRMSQGAGSEVGQPELHGHCHMRAQRGRQRLPSQVDVHSSCSRWEKGDMVSWGYTFPQPHCTKASHNGGLAPSPTLPWGQRPVWVRLLGGRQAPEECERGVSPPLSALPPPPPRGEQPTPPSHSQHCTSCRPRASFFSKVLFFQKHELCKTGPLPELESEIISPEKQPLSWKRLQSRPLPLATSTLALLK